MSNIATLFHQVSAVIDPATGYTTVSWDLMPSISRKLSLFRFDVQGSQSLSDNDDDWTKLNTSSIINANTFVDTTPRGFAYYTPYYYRLVYYDGATPRYADPITPYGSLTPREWRIVQETCRQAYRKLKEFGSGTDGYFLRRRSWGERCPDCLDPDIMVPINSQCTTCYGTGFTGGYFTALPTNIGIIEESQKGWDVSPPLGSIDTIIKQATCVAYPYMDANDLWVSKYKNDRFVIKKANTVSFVKELPVIYKLVLQLIPSDRVEYQIALT